ncbi:MAG: hypothetical protein JOZ17_28050, partial [Acetobacteraceae bacterium]|nr:hypothetical protein [Acetobacteraceae bacterium]
SQSRRRSGGEARPKCLQGLHDLGDDFAAAAEDDLTAFGDVIEQVVELGAGLSAGDGSLAVGANTDGRTESGPVAGGLGGADGDQYGGDATGGLAARFDGAVGEDPGFVEQGCGGGEEGGRCGLQAGNGPLPPAPSREGRGSYCGVEGVGEGVGRALVFAGDGAAVRLLQAREGGDEGAVLDGVGGEMVEPGADDGFDPGEGAELLSGVEGGADGIDEGVGEFGEDVGDQLGVRGAERLKNMPRYVEVGCELLAIDGGRFAGGEQAA